MIVLWFIAAFVCVAVVTVQTVRGDVSVNTSDLVTIVGIPMTGGVLGYMIKRVPSRITERRIHMKTEILKKLSSRKFLVSAAGIVSGIGFALMGYWIPGMALVAAGLVCGGLSVFFFFGCKAATRGMVRLTKKVIRAFSEHSCAEEEEK